MNKPLSSRFTLALCASLLVACTSGGMKHDADGGTDGMTPSAQLVVKGSYTLEGQLPSGLQAWETGRAVVCARGAAVESGMAPCSRPSWLTRISR